MVMLTMTMMTVITVMVIIEKMTGETPEVGSDKRYPKNAQNLKKWPDI